MKWAISEGSREVCAFAGEEDVGAALGDADEELEVDE